MIEQVEHNGRVMAIIVRNDFEKSGISFFTSHDYSQQLAFMKHQQGHIIKAHTHNTVERNVWKTQEVLFIKKGQLRVDLYDDHQVYLESRMLFPGDVILLAHGGHGFEVIKPLEMIEVKQGPYAGDQDKTCFTGVTKDQLVVKEVRQDDKKVFQEKDRAACL